jgi:type IV pilus assembly protein PilC
MEERQKKILYETLRIIDFGQYLNLDGFEDMCVSFEELEVKKNAKILGRGKVGKSFVIIGSGRVSVWEGPSDKDEKRTAELRPGDYFGETSLLYNSARRESFRADEDTLLFFVKKKHFNSLFIAVPEIKAIIEEKAIQREERGFAQVDDMTAPEEPARTDDESAPAPEEQAAEPEEPPAQEEAPASAPEEKGEEMLSKEMQGLIDDFKASIGPFEVAPQPLEPVAAPVEKETEDAKSTPPELSVEGAANAQDLRSIDDAFKDLQSQFESMAQDIISELPDMSINMGGASAAAAQPAEAKAAEVKPPEAQPVKAKAAEVKPPEAQPARAKAAEVKPPEAQPVKAKPAEVKPPEAQPVNAKPAEAEPPARKGAEEKPPAETAPGPEDELAAGEALVESSGAFADPSISEEVESMVQDALSSLGLDQIAMKPEVKEAKIVRPTKVLVEEAAPAPAPVAAATAAAPVKIAKPAEEKPRKKEIAPIVETFRTLREEAPFEEAELEQYKKVCRPMFFSKGAKIAYEGTMDESFSVIAGGKVALKKGPSDITESVLGPGDHFGEVSFLYDVSRSTTAIAEEDTALYSITRDHFFRCLVTDPQSEALMKKSTKDTHPDVNLSTRQIVPQDWIDTSSSPISGEEEKVLRKTFYRLKFQKYFKEQDFDRARAYFRKLEVKKDTEILKEGTIGYHFFVIGEGKIKTRTKDEQGQELLVEEAGKGEFFGEESLLFQRPLKVDYIAVEDSSLYIFPKKEFFRYFVVNDDVEAALVIAAEDAAEKVRKVSRAAASRKEEVLPLEEKDYPLLEETIKKLEFSEYLTQDDIEAFKKLFKKIVVAKDTKVLGKGKKGNAFIIVASGQISVRDVTDTGEMVEKAILAQAGYFGEEAMLLDKPRVADFWAATDSVLLYLSRKNFLKYFCTAPEVEKILKETAEYRMEFGYKKKFVEVGEVWVHEKAIPLTEKYFPLYHETMEKFEFNKHLKREEVIALRNFFRVYPVQKGKLVCKYGSKGEFFFILARGKIEVKKFTTEGEEITVHVIEPGAYFGEVSLLKDVPRNSNLLATANSILLVLTKNDFLEFFLSNQLVKQFITKKAEERGTSLIVPTKVREDRKAAAKAAKKEIVLSEDLEAAMNALRNTEFFQFMNRANLEGLLGRFQPVQYPPGSTIIMQEGTRSFNIIGSGKIVVMGIDGSGAERQVEKLETGEFFGEGELLDAEPIVKTYYSDGTTIVFRLNEEDFKFFMKADFGAKFNIERMNVRRRRVFERKFAARKSAADRVTWGGGIVKNSLLIAAACAGYFKNLARGVKNSVAYVIANLPNFSLLIALVAYEVHKESVLWMHRTRDKAIQIADDTKRTATSVVKSNVDSARKTYKEFVMKQMPPERRKCDEMSLAIFTRQMGIMMDVGLGLKRAFSILTEQTADKNLSYALSTIQTDVVMKGLPISMSMRRFPNMFSDFYVNLIRSGEVTGALGKAFFTTADFLERDINLKKRIQAAMTYPLVILICCIALLFGIVIFVMPTFVNLFESMSMTLPWTTRIIIAFVKGARNPFIMTGVGLFMVFLWYSFMSYYKTVQGKRLVDSMLVNAILVGDLMRKVLITRFCWTLSGLMAGGISVMESLKTSESVVTNAYMREQIEKCRLQVVQGKSLTDAFRKIELLPRMFKDLVMVGEETGNLSEQLKKVGDYFDMEIKYAIETFSSLLEPLLIVVMGIVIGIILISLFLPIYQLVQSFS